MSMAVMNVWVSLSGIIILKSVKSDKLVLIPGSKCQHKVDTKKRENHVSVHVVEQGGGLDVQSWSADCGSWYC